MRYRIDEISNEVSTGATYVLVSFWNTDVEQKADDPPILVNDFLMTLRDTAERIVTNHAGWLKRLSDGVFIDPATLAADDATVWEFESVTIDVPAQIQANIEGYIVRATAKDWAGDHTADASKPFYEGGALRAQRPSLMYERDAVDRNGVTSRTDVQSLLGGVRGTDR